MWHSQTAAAAAVVVRSDAGLVAGPAFTMRRLRLATAGCAPDRVSVAGQTAAQGAQASRRCRTDSCTAVAARWGLPAAAPRFLLHLDDFTIRTIQLDGGGHASFSRAGEGVAPRAGRSHASVVRWLHAARSAHWGHTTAAPALLLISKRIINSPTAPPSGSLVWPQGVAVAAQLARQWRHGHARLFTWRLCVHIDKRDLQDLLSRRCAVIFVGGALVCSVGSSRPLHRPCSSSLTFSCAYFRHVARLNRIV